jgi:hypothetical protein
MFVVWYVERGNMTASLHRQILVATNTECFTFSELLHRLSCMKRACNRVLMGRSLFMSHLLQIFRYSRAISTWIRFN